MCGRYTLINWEEMVQRFGVCVAGLKPRYNIAPTQELPVIVNDGRRRLLQCRWGLVPFWADSLSIGNKLINARAETVHEKASFRHSLMKRRCLVPADGFYEWQAIQGRKKPYRFSLNHGGLFAFAGLWEAWRDPAKETVYTFTIITTQANTLVEPLHSRMPVILKREAEEEWLNPHYSDVPALQKLLAPYPAEEMVAHQANMLVNSPANDVPEVLLPA